MSVWIEAVVASGEPSEGWAVVREEPTWSVLAFFFEREHAELFVKAVGGAIPFDSARPGAPPIAGGLFLRAARLDR